MKKALISFLCVNCVAASAFGAGEKADADPNAPPAAVAEVKVWPRQVEGFVPPESGEHPRLFFRKADIARLRERAKTPEGQAIVKRLRLLLGGGEEMPTFYQAARKAYQGEDEAAAEDVGKSGAGGLNQAMPPDLGKLGDELDAIGQEGKAKGTEAVAPRPPWARPGWTYGFDNLPLGTYTVSHAAGFGFLWILTGERKYADLARQCVELAYQGQRDTDNRYSWFNPGGMLRTGPAVACYAMAYDLCYDAWPEEFRKDFAQRVQNYKMETGETMEALCLNPRLYPHSNHYGMQVGGATIAMLAIMGDPGTDPELFKKYKEGLDRNTHKFFDEGMGSMGCHLEGHHPTRMTAAWIEPAMQARRVAVGEDWVTGNSNASWMCTHWLYEIVRSGDALLTQMNGMYAREYSRGGMNGGDFCQGLGVAPREHVPAIKWFFNHVIDPRPTEEKDYDAVQYPHRAMLALVNWPIDVEERNPGEILPKCFHDFKKGVTVFRNGWHDNPGDDATLNIDIGTRWGWGGGQGAMLKMIAMGKKWELPCDLTKCSTTSYVKYSNDGSGIFSVVVKNTYVGVDYSRASGADVLVVMTGERAGEMKPTAMKPTAVAKLGSGWKIYIVTLQKGAPPAVRVDGDTLHVGGQTVTWGQGRFAFGKMADGPAPFERDGHFIHIKSPPPDKEDQKAKQAADRAAKLAADITKARDLVEKKKYTEAGPILEKIMKDAPGSPEAGEAKALQEKMLLEPASGGGLEL